MKVVAVLGYKSDENTPEYIRLREGIEGCGHGFELLDDPSRLTSDADLVLSLGGDGTFLRVARFAALSDIPVLGVNFGTLGFLSENTVDATVRAFETGHYSVKERSLLCARTHGGEFFALNEIAVRRSGPAMLGVKAFVDERELPTYWGDGLIVATAAGSTAYNLSVGGPIVFPSSKVLIISPIAPHNLNVRPLVIPSDRGIRLSFVSRDEGLCFSADNQSLTLDRDSSVEISLAQFSLKRVCLEDSSFVKALCDKLSWGEDKRNER